jgi:hypothetical protein
MATNTGTDNIDIAPENDDFEAVDVQTSQTGGKWYSDTPPL